MKILFSVPTGYHLRELLLPLKSLLEGDSEIEKIFIMTPAADFHSELFASFSDKFTYLKNPKTLEEHKELMKTHAPDVVVTDTVGNDPYDYLILKSASDSNIPTLTFIASWDNVWKIERLHKVDKPIHISDHLIVWNQMMKDHLLRIFPNLTADTISVIGAPRFDYFWKKEHIPSKKELYDYLGFSDTSKPLIHFSTTELYPMDYLVEAVASAIKAKQLPDSHLYASVHPGGNLDNHAELKVYKALVRYSFGRRDTSPHPDFQYLPTEEEIYMLVALFTHADVLINHSSTTAIESLVGHTPVINVKYGRPLDWWRWYRSMVYRDFAQHYMDITSDGATALVTNKKQLISETADALQNPDKRARERDVTVKKMITTVDGSASQQVFDVIKKHAV